jgi:uncharacterized cupin superfamily protein
VANVNDPVWDEDRGDTEGFRAKRARVGWQVGSERLGVSVWELPPGQAAYPYHFHYVEEELVIVTQGRPSLRTPDGWRELEEGAVVPFLRGEQGAHQIANRTGEPVRFIAVSTNGEPDLVIQPDSQKLLAAERLPAGTPGFRGIFRLADQAAYLEGEQPPASQ